MSHLQKIETKHGEGTPRLYAPGAYWNCASVRQVAKIARVCFSKQGE